MVDPPEPEPILDITGPEDETIFWHAKAFVAKHQNQLHVEIDEMWNHIEDVADDRLVALVGALCIENSVDALLEAIGPGFRALRGRPDFTFSLKVDVARSLRLLPTRILTSCDLIRQLRNEFAHNLNVKDFGQCDPKDLNKLSPHVAAFSTAESCTADYRALFKSLTAFTTLALSVYTLQVAELRRYLNTSHFRDGLGRYAVSRS